MASEAYRQPPQLQKRMQKELTHMRSEGCPPGITLTPVPNTDLREWTSTIYFSPEDYPDSPYVGGTFHFTLNVTPDPETNKIYPFAPPEVFCKTPLYSPHVNATTGKVEFSTLAKSSWCPVWIFQTVMLSLMVALNEPEIGYPADELRLAEYLDNEEYFWEQAREWTALHAMGS